MKKDLPRSLPSSATRSFQRDAPVARLRESSLNFFNSKHGTLLLCEYYRACEFVTTLFSSRTQTNHLLSSLKLCTSLIYRDQEKSYGDIIITPGDRFDESPPAGN